MRTMELDLVARRTKSRLLTYTSLLQLKIRQKEGRKREPGELWTNRRALKKNGQRGEEKFPSKTKRKKQWEDLDYIETMSKACRNGE